MIRKFKHDVYLKLVEEASDLYPLREPIFSIVASIGLDPGDANLQGTGKNMWESVLDLVTEEGKASHLINQMLVTFPNRPLLQQLNKDIQDGTAFEEISSDVEIPAEIYSLINQYNSLAAAIDRFNNLISKISNTTGEIRRQEAALLTVNQQINQLQNTQWNNEPGVPYSTFAANKETAINNKTNEYNQINVSLEKNNSDLDRYKNEKETARQEHITELKQTFTVLDRAITVVEQLQPNFNRFVWFKYFHDELSAGRLAVEVLNLADQVAANEINDNFMEAFKRATDTLDKDEIDVLKRYPVLRVTIQQDTKRLKSLSQELDYTNKRVRYLSSRLERVRSMKGLSTTTLTRLKIMGGIALATGPIGFILVTLFGLANTNKTIPIYFLVIIIIGVIILIYRAAGHKEARIKNISERLTKVSSENLSNQAAHKELNAKLEKEQAAFASIIENHPILAVVPFK